MEFGIYLDRHIIAEWSTQYVRYKRLTQIIQQIAWEKEEQKEEEEEEEENDEAIEGNSGARGKRKEAEAKLRQRRTQSASHHGQHHHYHHHHNHARSQQHGAHSAQPQQHQQHVLTAAFESEHQWIERSTAHVVAMEEAVEKRTRSQEGRMVRRVSDSSIASNNSNPDSGTPSPGNGPTPINRSSFDGAELDVDGLDQDEASLDLALNGGKDFTDSLLIQEDPRLHRLTHYIPSEIKDKGMSKLQQVFWKMMEEDLDTINHFFLKQEEFFLSKINVIVSQLDRLIREEEEAAANSKGGRRNVGSSPVDTVTSSDNDLLLPRSPSTPSSLSSKHEQVRNVLQQNVAAVEQMDRVNEEVNIEAQRRMEQPGVAHSSETMELLLSSSTTTASVSPPHPLTSPLDHLAESASVSSTVPASSAATLGRFLRENIPAHLSHLSHAIKGLPHSSSLQAPLLHARERIDVIAHRAALLLKMRLLTAEDPWLVLEKALQELYRGLHLLRNYKILNFTAFVKILRQYDALQLHPLKSLKNSDAASSSLASSTLQVTPPLQLSSTSLHLGYWTSSSELLPRIQSTHFNASPILRTFIRKVELIFASAFTEGDHHVAKQNLRVVPHHRLKGSVMFGLGLSFGIGIIMFALLLLMVCWVANQLQTNVNLTLNVSLPVWRCLALIIIHICGWGINVHLFHRFRLNHSFIFEMDPHTELRFEQILLVVAGFSLLWFTLLDAYLFVELVKSAGRWSDALTGFFPFLLYLIFFCVVFNPFDCFFLSTRKYLLGVLWKIIAAPFYPVLFRDFYVADQLCSLVNVMNDFMYSFCWFASGHFLTQTDSSLSDTWCLHAQKQTVWIIAVLPYWWRLLQCLRKYRDNPPSNVRQLWNAGKYFSSIVTTLLSLCNKTYPNSAFYPLWIIAALVTTCYTAYWDLAFDWGLFEFTVDRSPSSASSSSSFSISRLKPKLFPRKLVLPSFAPYYFAMISNILLRLTWVLTISPSNFGLSIPPAYFTTVIWTLEVVRRNQWNFFRLENEHLTNCENYRVVNIVPLNMDVTADTTTAAKKLKQNKSAKISRQNSVDLSNLGMEKNSLQPRRSRQGSLHALMNEDASQSNSVINRKKLENIRKNISLEDLHSLVNEHHTPIMRSTISTPQPPQQHSAMGTPLPWPSSQDASASNSTNTTQTARVGWAPSSFPSLQYSSSSSSAAAANPSSNPSTPLATTTYSSSSVVAARETSDTLLPPMNQSMMSRSLSQPHLSASSATASAAVSAASSISNTTVPYAASHVTRGSTGSIEGDLHLFLTEFLQQHDLNSTTTSNLTAPDACNLDPNRHDDPYWDHVQQIEASNLMIQVDSAEKGILSLSSSSSAAAASPPPSS